jgi:AcrR family transcriptional regulator
MRRTIARNEPSPREKRRLRTRAAVLDEALALMGESGLDGIGVRELARRLNYSPAALYRYFENREQIISTLTADSMTLLGARLKAAAKEAEADPLIAVGEAYLAFAKEEPLRFRLLFVDARSGRRSLKTAPPRESPYAIVLESARAAIAGGRISPDLDAETVAFTIWSLVHGMAVLESTHLHGFRADFGRAHKLALQYLVNSWLLSSQQRSQT